jgi:hypothetical protein
MDVEDVLEVGNIELELVGRITDEDEEEATDPQEPNNGLHPAPQ